MPGCGCRTSWLTCDPPRPGDSLANLCLQAIPASEALTVSRNRNHSVSPDVSRDLGQRNWSPYCHQRFVRGFGSLKPAIADLVRFAPGGLNPGILAVLPVIPAVLLQKCR